MSTPSPRVSLAILSLALAASPAGAADKPAWKVEKTETLKGLKVSLARPVLVARSKGYLWFPTLIRRDGDLLALMSDYPDEHTKTSTSKVAWSGDGVAPLR